MSLLHFFKKQLQSLSTKHHQDSSMQSLSHDLTANFKHIQSLFSYAPDFTYKSFMSKSGSHCMLLFLDNLVDQEKLNNQILKPLQYDINQVNKDAIPFDRIEEKNKISDLENALLTGNSVLLEEGQTNALIFSTQNFPLRSISEPKTESTLKGSQQGFIESIGKNIALIRRYLPNRQLMIKSYSVGKRAPTQVALIFLHDVANPEIIAEVEDRIQQIQVDSIINTGELIEYIEDHPSSVFPQILQTERPDAVASHLLQGRFAILVDHSPYSLVAPMTFFNFFSVIDDYSNRWMTTTFFRFLRYWGFFIATSLPAFYIATLTFSYEILPVDLLFSIGESRIQVPFHPLIEALIMEVSSVTINIASARLTAPVGQTVGIVGGVILGQAAVQAGIVSNIMVIVIAITTLSTFIIPNTDVSSSVQIIRFPMMIIASLFGFTGISIGYMIIAALIINMESFGVSFGNPVSPIHLHEWKDLMIRFPNWKIHERPVSADTVQAQRDGNSRQSGDQ
ncbi:spore germination protein [Hazenella sp. IB182353]|uniref:spore germination protein n=1 Tax=Polycladospora coralii TaxID=2771432 RepID=UPI001746E002|nr:spore germination protein [Polycladospora coralii]MBS7529706.1 spore germination protein [Polycladospora coralii]